MNFGLTQWAKTVPKIVKNIRNALIGFLSGITAFTPLIVKYLNIPAEDFAMICGASSLVVISVAQMFGVSDEMAIQMAQEKIEMIKKKNIPDDGS